MSYRERLTPARRYHYLLLGSSVVLASMGVAARQDTLAAPAKRPLPVFAHSFCAAATPAKPALPYEPLQEVKLAEPWPDYVAMMSSQQWKYPDLHFFAGPNPSLQPAQTVSRAGFVVEQAGWICAASSGTAHDACVAKVATLEVAEASLRDPRPLWPYYLVVQRGADQQVLGTWREALDLLGPIDTLAKASFVAILHRYRIECGFSTGQAHGGGFRLTVQTGSPFCGDVDAHVVDVERDGTLSVRASQTVKATTFCGYGNSPQVPAKKGAAERAH